MRRNPDLIRRKPVPDYLPSPPTTAAPPYSPPTPTPPLEKDDSLPPLVETKREKLVFRRQHRQQQLEQAQNLMVGSTLTLVISGMLERGPGPDSESDQGPSYSSPYISTQVPRPSEPSSPSRSQRRRSVHKAYRPPTPPIPHSGQRRTRSRRGSVTSSEAPEMQQLSPRTSFISIRQSWRASNSQTRYSLVLNTDRTQSLSSREDVLSTVHEAAPHQHTIDTRFIFRSPKRASLTGDSLLSRRTVKVTFKRLRGWGKTIRTKFSKFLALSLPPGSAKY
ncbi:hypothetical protein QCA50_000532 [Cerrena zonata]|uniref:Uncharacterized protein n=1 Tax=Cerrena zonata TaxID=2478898 RepID=A0AAW0GQI7_9APHY